MSHQVSGLMRRTGLACFSALILMAGLIPAWAQSDRGTITGTVSDPAGAIVPGAKIAAKNAETGAAYETVTTATGNYTLPSLVGGTYDLTVEAAGFSKYIQQGIKIQVVQTARIDIVLKLGSTNESVTVNADAPLLKTESAEQSKSIGGDKINQMPMALNGGVRNPIVGIMLAPGVYSPNPGSFTIRVNGGLNNTYKVLMDGQDITMSGSDPSHLSESQPSVDSLEEVTLQSSNFAAEFGQVAGGLVNLTSRSGTNQYHGTAYEYLRNEFLDAGRPYTNDGSGHLVRPRSRNHNFGFTAGGPVRIPKLYNGHNKTFFFFNLEVFKTRNVTAGTFTTVTTDAYRKGDFSAALTGRNLGTDALGRALLEGAIYDPGTERTVNGQVLRDPFVGNIIPQNLMDPVAQKIQALIPAPTNAGLTNNLAINEATSRKTLIPSLKLDHNFSVATKLSIYLTEFWQDVPKSGADGLPFPISPARIFTDRTPTFRLSLDHVVTPTFLVHFGAGEVRYDHIDSSPSSVLDYDAVKLLGLVGSGTNPAGFPNLLGLSASQGGMSSTIGPVNANNYYNDKPTGVVSGTWVRGNHTFKFGGEWRRDIWEDINTRGAQGKYNFSGNSVALPYLPSANVGGGSIGFPYASFYLGLVNTASTQNKQDPQIRKAGVGIYVQDAWKITRKLTLEYGLRWDYETQWREIHDRTASFSPNVINPTVGGLPGGTIYEGSGPKKCNCSFTDAYPLAFGPRLGVAYQIDSKTVFRAGWGLIYGRTGDGNYITNTAIVGVGYNTLDYSSTFAQPGAILRNGLSYTQADLYAATFDPGIRPQSGQVNSPPYYIDRSGGRPSRVNQWNVALQREISRNLTLEAAYVGNRGAWLRADSMIDWNGVTLDRIRAAGLDLNNSADRTLLTSTFAANGPNLAARGFKIPYAGFPLAQTLAQALRPFPQFSAITVRWAARGDSWYDSLQMKLTKRFSHGFDFTGAFTFQKELSLGLDATNDIYNRANNKYISSSSQPLVLAMGFTYETPAIGAGRLLRGVTRGWTVGGLFRYSSGLPIQVPGAQNNLSAYLFRSTLANRVSGQPLFLKNLNCHCIDPNNEFVLNRAAWSDPAQGQWGTAAAYYDDYRQQRRPAEQLGIGRMFHIRERVTLQIRGEFFNVFNRTQMASPSSGNALQTESRNAQGVPIAGFGYINATALASGPRQGQLLARFQF